MNNEILLYLLIGAFFQGSLSALLEFTMRPKGFFNWWLPTIAVRLVSRNKLAMSQLPANAQADDYIRVADIYCRPFAYLGGCTYCMNIRLATFLYWLWAIPIYGTISVWLLILYCFVYTIFSNTFLRYAKIPEKNME